MVVGKVGEPLGGDRVLDEQSKDHELYHGVPYEMHFSFEPGERLSQSEAEEIAATAMRQWLNKNPDHEVHYIGISDMSETERSALALSEPAYEVTAEVTTASPQLVGALVAAGIAALVAAYGAVGWGAVIVAFITAYAIFRAADYVFGPKEFACPKCHEKFTGIEDLQTHLATKHPDQPETNQEIMNLAKEYAQPSWKTTALWIGGGVAAAIVLSKALGGK